MTHADPATGPAFPIVIVGHVDHGKSTLIGRLLNDTGALPEGKLEELKQVSKRRGVPIEWSFALDALQLERDQAITVDSTQIWFRTAVRRYVIIDAPGHREFLRNMITGAAQAEAAVIVVDAMQGLTEQTKRHAYLLHLLGVARVIVAVNKMDKIGFDPSVFAHIADEAREHLAGLSLALDAVVPVAARDGDNLAQRSARSPWWSGPTLLEALDALPRRGLPADGPLRLTVQDVYRDGDARIVIGRIDSGRLKVGNRVAFWPTRRSARVKAFHRWNSDAPIVSAAAPQAVAFTLDEDLFVERGHVAATPTQPPHLSDAMRARLFWLGQDALTTGRRLRLHVGTASVEATVTAVRRVLDAETLRFVDAGAAQVNDVAEVTLRTAAPVVFDPARSRLALGRGVLTDGYGVVGGCVIDGLADDCSSGLAATAEGPFAPAQRGAVLWLTGLSGAGKSTLAAGLHRALQDRGVPAVVLDGDALRRGLNADLGYTPADRAENLRRAAEVAKLLAASGLVVVAALISPTAADRHRVRAIVGKGFHEIFVNADLAVCERRDVKGLYAQARAGAVADFTGISAPWEPPQAPDLEVNTAAEPYSQCLARLVAYVERVVPATAAAPARVPSSATG